MTRTSRAAYPRAVIRDRSESRTGLDPSIRKSGAGHHNWGSLADELHLEEAIGDEDMETGIDSDSSTRSLSPERQAEKTRVLTEKEVETARNFRKNAFKGGKIDLTAIARTSSAVLTPSPVSPIASRDGHDNKPIPVHSV